ncbi:MAG: hypothetical protein JWO69_556 [Thermoleophilia bacterium]|jgi:hypothetical protein|nr:hypothetical protein [Thermoleophilia bacterium]
MKKLLLAVVALAVIIVVILAVRLVGARDETDTVDAQDAQALIENDDDASDDDAPGIAGDRPEPGTYTYEGSGSESVTILGGSKHDFPAEVAVVVELDDDNEQAWTANAVFVKQHIEERDFRTTNAGLEDLGFRREIEFFGQVQDNRYECSDGAERFRADAEPGSTTSWTCTQEGDKATIKYTSTLVGTEALEIGGEQVETWHVKVDSTQSGDTVGTDASEFWYAETGLAVRMKANLRTRTKSVLGETDFRERYDYTLASLVPE